MSNPVVRYSQADEFYFQEGCFIREILNDASDNTMSIAQARVEPGKTTRWHQLVDTTERYVITLGEGLVEVGDSLPTRVEKGDVVTIDPMVPQRITNTGDSDLIFLAICTPRFSPEVYKEVEK